VLVLGIDPGLVTTGYGFIQSKNNTNSIIDYGTISPKKTENLSRRLNTIYQDVSYIIDEYQPSIMAIEEVFYGKNVKSALLLGHARGVAMVSASKNNIPVFEYSARKVKQSVTGNGTAHKSQVQYMIMQSFNLKNFKFSLDASDALAIALCHINQIKLEEL
tara:strand:- start:1150 stop:1632 length:483 start_codon:yes stop_codon:yes gene_type:complete